MGDGGHDATLDRQRASGAGNGEAPGPQPTVAAPWERFAEPSVDHDLHRWQAEPVADTPAGPVEPEATDAEKAGCHTDGALTVAELIAKIGAPAPKPSGHRHVTADEDPAADAPEVPVELQDTQVIDAVPYSLAVVSELPDLGAVNYPGDDEPETDQARPRRGLRKCDRRSSPPGASDSADAQPGHRRRPILIAGRSLAALFAVLAVAMTGGAWQWSTSKNARLNTISALDPHSADIRDPGGQYGDEDFLIVGMDSRAGENANMGAGDSDDAGGARSDTVMLVNIPANRKRVVAVSFPRDLAITPIQCEAWNPDTGKYGPVYDEKRGTFGPKMVYTETKLNSTFSFGGPKCLVKEIQKLSGLSINRFIAVDFAGFARMVDALGGVEVCTKTPLHDYELGTVLDVVT